MADQFYLDEQMQDLLLACMCNHAPAFAVVGQLVLPEYFWGVDATKTAAAIQDFKAETGEYPTLKALDGYLKELYGREKADLYESAAKYIKKLKGINTRNFKWVRDMTVKFCRERAVIVAIRSAAELVKTGKMPDAGFARVFEEANLVGSQNEVEDCANVEQKPLPMVIVDGVIHCGHKLIIGGSSKSKKTWLLIDLAVRAATGTPWLSLPCEKGPVLYVNFELDSAFFQSRLNAVLQHHKLKLEPGFLHHWCLRGKCRPIDEMMPLITQKAKELNAYLVILDPMYKLMLGTGKNKKDENSAADWANVMDALEKLAVNANCATATGAHFSKGSQAGKESLDRISGSGVSARDPDTILTLTAHEVPDVFAVEVTARNFAPVAPFCIKWEYPSFEVSDHDPAELKQPKRGSSKTFSDSLWLRALPPECDEPVPREDWMNAVIEASAGISPKHKGMSERTFRDRAKELLKRGVVEKIGEGFVRASGQTHRNGHVTDSGKG